jgi:chaperonin GroEL (HSP60 family)
MYQKVNPNHIYAAPNKFYESMFLGKTIFTTKGTIVGTKVENNTIGYISEETESDILNVIKTIETSDTKSKGSNSAKLWNQSFKDYTNLYMNNVYSKLIGKKN